MLRSVWQHEFQELVSKEHKGELKTVSFPFKVISTYLDAFVA
jgi:hypothetical protein